MTLFVSLSHTSILYSFLFFFQGYGDHRDLHSFPTRRSSDLRAGAEMARRGGATDRGRGSGERPRCRALRSGRSIRSEEHTSELQSHSDLVCRLLLEKKKKAAKKPHQRRIIRYNTK